jgi:hypothetical protein
VATHDYVISNGTGSAVRSDINGALAAIVSQNSNASAPATTYAYMSWADTSAGVMKMRNGANSAWISLYELDGTFLASDISLAAGSAAAPSLFFTGDTNTGLFSPGADTVALATAGSNRLHITSGGLVGLGTSSPTGALEVGAVTGAVTSGDLLVTTGSTTASVTVGRTSGTSSDNTAFNVRNRIGTSIFYVDTGNQRVGIGTTGPAQKLEVVDGSISVGSSTNTSATNVLIAGYGYNLSGTRIGNTSIRSTYNFANNSASLEFYVDADGISTTERMRITTNGTILIGNTSVFSTTSSTATGSAFGSDGTQVSYVSGSTVAFFGRQTNDGTIIDFRQDGTQEGSISVSGTTVSYNGAHLSRWSQLPDGATREEILRGTVLSNIDEMCGWGEEDNEQLNRMKVSDVEGDKNVSGVFQAWDDDDDTYTDDFYCAMTGDFIIRIAEGVTVQRGDLLMSAGDGTAKPQDDDIIRSKTVAKVTSTHVTCTYEDGSYCVPCVLMAC